MLYPLSYGGASYENEQQTIPKAMRENTPIRNTAASALLLNGFTPSPSLTLVESDEPAHGRSRSREAQRQPQEDACDCAAIQWQGGLHERPRE